MYIDILYIRWGDPVLYSHQVQEKLALLLHGIE